MKHTLRQLAQAQHARAGWGAVPVEVRAVAPVDGPVVYVDRDGGRYTVDRDGRRTYWREVGP